MLKSIPLLIETMHALLTNLKRECLIPETGKTGKRTKIFKNLKRMRILSKEFAKFVIFKS